MKLIHIFIISAVAILFILGIIMVFSPKEPSTLPTSEPPLKDTVIFNASPGIDYSTSDNIEKLFTIGTFNNNLVLTVLSLTFDIDYSIFNNSSITITINDINNNEIYNTTILRGEVAGY